MGSGGGGLTTLGLALVLVFVFLFLALVAELLYMLCYRRRLRRGQPGGEDDPELAAAGVVDGGLTPNSKELLLYFLCWKNQSRIEPTPAVATAPKSPPPTPPPASSPAAVDAELARWRALYASRVLFTITEEEKEGSESDAGSARFAVGRGSHVAGVKAVDRKRVVGAVAEEEEEEEEEEVSGLRLTPFSTPCASPPFYTPPPSPGRWLEAGVGVEIQPDADTSGDEGFSPAAGRLPCPPR